MIFSNGMIPARFLTLTAHFIILVVLLWDRVSLQVKERCALTRLNKLSQFYRALIFGYVFRNTIILTRLRTKTSMLYCRKKI